MVIGKIGRDIEEKKCGWLVCQAPLRATPEQKQIIQGPFSSCVVCCVCCVSDIPHVHRPSTARRTPSVC